MDTWKDLKSSVERNGNVLTISMKELRDVAGKNKLGKNVVKEIKENLASVCLGHVPQVLPLDQNALVRLYKCDTDISKLIETIAIPNEKTDKELLDLLASEKRLLVYEKMFSDIRAQVGYILCSECPPIIALFKEDIDSVLAELIEYEYSNLRDIEEFDTKVKNYIAERCSIDRRDVIEDVLFIYSYLISIIGKIRDSNSQE